MSDDERIRISWDDLQDVPADRGPSPPPLGQSSESWGYVAPQPSVSRSSASGNLTNKAWFYLGVAGLLAGLVAWAGQELIIARDVQFQSRVQVQIRMGFWFAFVGAVLAAGIGSAEGVVSRSGTQIARGVCLGLPVGAVGGFVAGFLAQGVYSELLSNGSGDIDTATVIFARSVAWALCGGVAAASFGATYLSGKRALLGLIGGLVGGLIGGVLFDVVAISTTSDVISRFIGIVSIGAISGLVISIAEEVAKTAWVSIEAGRLVGKQFVIYKNPTRIGALPSNEIYLFKDTSVAPVHATIEQRAGAYFVVDQGSHTGVVVNGRAVREQRLRDGDQVQIGETLLRYGEKRRD